VNPTLIFVCRGLSSEQAVRHLAAGAKLQNSGRTDLISFVICTPAPYEILSSQQYKATSPLFVDLDENAEIDRCVIGSFG
jgi:hypothetical protein